MIATALLATLAALLLRPMLEHEVRARIESTAARHGAVARIGVVHVGIWPSLRLEGFDLDLGSRARSALTISNVFANESKPTYVKPMDSRRREPFLFALERARHSGLMPEKG